VGNVTVDQFGQDPAIWTDNPVSVMLRVLELQKRTSPLVGGASQVALIDRRGGRWVNRPSAAAMRTALPACATMTAAISMTAPDITATATGGAFVCKMNATDGFKVTGNNITTSIVNATAGIGFAAGVKVTNGPSGSAFYTVLGSSGIYYANASNVVRAFIGQGAGDTGNVKITDGTFGSSLELKVSAAMPQVLMNGSQVLRDRHTGTPVTLADVITVLQWHGLCN
jgi:hypothetical protein